jgi:hypothetical protein
MLSYVKTGIGLLAVGCAIAAIPANAQGRHGVSWSGIVDDTVIVYIHGDRGRTETVSGNSPRNVSNRTFGRLPDRPVRVFLEDRDGRGRITVIQQPSERNDYTAAVRIYDPDGGSARYHFSLDWQGRDRQPWGRRDRNRYDNDGSVWDRR